MEVRARHLRRQSRCRRDGHRSEFSIGPKCFAAASAFSKRQDFKSNGTESVKRDGLAGARWSVSWNENGVLYYSVMELFTVGDDHYRLTALAPKEVYDRYTENFENMFGSVRFPMLRTDPRVLEGLQ